LLTGFSALLGGDAERLRQFYTISVVENATTWTLTLAPLTPSQHLRALVVDAAAGEPHCFTVQQSDGDSSTLLLGPLAAKPLPQPLTPAAIAAMCKA